MRTLSSLLWSLPAIALGCGGSFYVAPPTLEHYPERLPIKTMRELLRDGAPAAAPGASFDTLEATIRSLAKTLHTAPRNELLKQIDAALQLNRTGDYRKRFANCLFDFRDLLLASDSLPPGLEINAYASDRLDAMAWDDGFVRRQPRPPAYATATPEDTEKSRLWLGAYNTRAAWLAGQIKSAGALLKPHWLIQAGAWEFRHARFEEAAGIFKNTIAEFPKHPRAEIAQLMLARARIEQWRELEKKAGPKARSDAPRFRTEYEAAQDALVAYSEAYPGGRFAPDIGGWRAGLARENGEIATALSLFLQQTDWKEHPEIVRGALRQAEACLDELDPGEFEDTPVDGRELENLVPIDEIAGRPAAAMAVVYHFLDSESRRDFGDLLARSDFYSEVDVTERLLAPALRMRRAGRVLLPALAKAVAVRKENFGGAIWRPKYLAVLAWAASESGEHPQAIRLCQLAGPALDSSDDLLFVHAVACQRDGRLDAAIAGFRRLEEKFPLSPLASECRFRIATAFRDKNERGLAAVELLRMEDQMQQARNAAAQSPGEPGESPVPAAPALHLAAEISQWIETLLQFSPLAELETGYASPELEPEFSARLRKVMRGRYLAREDFAAATRFRELLTETPAGEKTPDPKLERAEEEKPDPTDTPVGDGELSRSNTELEGVQWTNASARLQTLTRELSAAATPLERAQKAFALAETWASLRGRFTLPAADFQWKAAAQNARFAGFKDPGAELESRDEFQHALAYYRLAAKSLPGTPLAAQALRRANDSIRAIAELSEWALARAFETNATALSKELLAALPDKPAPKSAPALPLAVWWDFPPPVESSWLPGDTSFYTVEVRIAEAFSGRQKEDGESPHWADFEAFEKRLLELPNWAGIWDAPRLLQELAAIRTDLLPVYSNARGSRIINHLDDLALFLHEPKLTASGRAKYLQARLDSEPPDLNDPEMAPWLDYLTFLALVRETGAGDPVTGKSAERPMSVRMEEFLKKFPRSHKREAAMARLALAKVRESHGHTGVQSTEWPLAPKLFGYNTLGIDREAHTAPDPKAAFAALDAYDREFPAGRYAADIRLGRAIASIDERNWARAIDLLCATLDDGAKRDLHLDASLNLAYVFMRLIDEPLERQAIVIALRKNRHAQIRLSQFMQSPTMGMRLRLLKGWLDESFAQH